MSWRYAVTRQGVPNRDGEVSYWYAIREVYTDETGISWTEDEIAAGGETLEEVNWALARMKEALLDLPILDITDEKNAYWVE